MSGELNLQKKIIIKLIYQIDILIPIAVSDMQGPKMGTI